MAKATYFSEEEQRQIVTLYLQGKGLPALQEQFRLNSRNLTKILSKFGHKKRAVGAGFRKPPESIQDQIVEIYLSGKTTNEIAAQLGLTEKVCLTTLHRRGVPTRSSPLREEEKRIIAEKSREGMPLKRIAKLIGRSPTACKRFVMQEGLPHRKAIKPVDTIPPFPDSVDRDAFGYYLSGLTDGEGSFSLLFSKTYQYPKARFTMNLRADDMEILQMIQSYWGCGRLTFKKGKGASNPQWSYAVEHLSHVEQLVEHFKKYPLYAKKRRDFVIWEQGILLIRKARNRPRVRCMGRGFAPRWTDEEKAEFIRLMNLSRQQRQFQPSD